MRADQDSQDTSDLLIDSNTQATVTLDGVRVMDAHESLSVPARFIVQDLARRQWSVATNQYHHLGAAAKDDTVSVHGHLSDSDTITLTDPNSHYIYMPTLS